jgi:hypothetical protein
LEARETLGVGEQEQQDAYDVAFFVFGQLPHPRPAGGLTQDFELLFRVCMKKFSPLISKPADFGVSNQEVTDIVTRIRGRGQSTPMQNTGASLISFATQPRSSNNSN